MRGPGLASAAVLLPCALVLFLPCNRIGVAAVNMGALDRMFFRPNQDFTDREGKDGDFVRFSDSIDSSQSGPSSDPWTHIEQKPVPKGTTKGRYQATRRIRPPYWVRSDDPNHPNMRIYVDPRDAHTVNLLPENSHWKDHDSEVDDGHPNERVLTTLDQNSSEASEAFWDVLEEQRFDVKRWKDDDKYEALIDQYGLQDVDKVSHLAPKLWFEPMSSGEEEEARFEAGLVHPHVEDEIPHSGYPFCAKCHMMLGVARPALSLTPDPGDPRCRFCGYLNAHDGGGRLLNDPEVSLTEFEPSPTMRDVVSRDAESWLRPVESDEESGGDAQQTVQPRKQTEQRCDECGHQKAYYHTRQVAVD